MLLYDDLSNPGDESDRKAALPRPNALNTPPEPIFELLVELAAAACRAPIALLSLVGAELLSVKARIGLEIDEMARAGAPCVRAIEDGRALVVADIGADVRFRDGTLAADSAGVHGYAGAPLVTAGGYGAGVLCVCFRQATELAPEQVVQLERLAAVAARCLEAHDALNSAQAAEDGYKARISELEFAHSMLEAQATQLVALAEDRDELYQANLRQSEFIETLMDTVPIPIFARDPSLRITHANLGYATFLGVDRDAVLGRTLDEIVGVEALQAEQENDRLLLAEPTGRCTFEKRIQLGDSGESRDVVLHKARLKAQDGTFLGVVGAIVDVTEAKALQSRLEQMAATDPLTGAANRRAFMEKAAAELRRSARYGRPLSLIMIDIDRFKAINDDHGHQAGDEALRRVAAVCMAAIRNSIDLFARIGGEEFVIVLPETDADGAVRLAERLRCAIAGEPVAYRGVAIAVTASFGVSQVVPTGEGCIDDALKRADACLYLSKQRGRNRVTVHAEVEPVG